MSTTSKAKVERAPFGKMADGTEVERYSERVDRRRLIQGTCRRQLRGRINHPIYDFKNYLVLGKSDA